MNTKAPHIDAPIHNNPPHPEGSRSEASPSIAGSKPETNDTFGEYCAKLLDLFSKAVIMMTFMFTIMYGLLNGHFDVLFVPLYGWVFGAMAFLFSTTILVVGTMSRFAEIQKQRQKEKVTVIQAICGSLLFLAMVFAAMYCAGASLVGVEKLQSNMAASASKQVVRQ